MKYYLDTNVWSYVLDTNSVRRLLSATGSGTAQFVVAPASISEARNFPLPLLRKQLLVLMTNDRWSRVLPESWLEAEEIKRALIEINPDWALPAPDFREVNAQTKVFTRRRKGFWEASRNERPIPVTDESLREARENELARIEVREIRKLFKDDDREVAEKHLQNVLIPLPRPIAGLRYAEYWRTASHYHFMSELKFRTSPYRERIDCELDVEAIQSEPDELARIWFHELTPGQTKRQWLRTSMEYLQRYQKPTDGSPVDSQLTSHLLDADFFVTADKNFARSIKKINSEAPFETAKALLIKAGQPGVDELMNFVAGGLPNRSS